MLCFSQMKPISNKILRKIIEENSTFSLVYRRDRHLKRGERRTYFYFRPHFAITLSKDKEDLLRQVAETLGCGKVSISGGQARLDILSPVNMSAVFELFKNHQFESRNKQVEFELFKEAIGIIKKYRRRKVNAEKGKRGFVSVWNSISQQDIRRLFRIREEMKRYKRWKKTDYKWTNTILASPFRI